MNAKTMSAILEHMDAKSVRICMLDEKLRKADEMFRQWKTLLGLDAKLTGPEVEEAIKRMNFDRSTLQTNYQHHVQLQRALDSLVDLPRLTDESYSAYAYRVGRVLADRTGRGTELAALADKRLNDLAALHIKLAKLETRESELNALHDTIESLPGFPMQPPESYVEYLQRLASANKLNAERATAMDGHLQAIEKAILKADAFRKLPKESFAEYITRLAADRARLTAALDHLTASTQETTQRLREQLDGNNQQYAESMAVIDDLRKQRDEWTQHKYLVHFEPGAHGLSWAVVDKGVITEISPFLSGSDVRGLSAPKPQIGLWFTRVVHKPCPNSLQSVQVEMPVVIRAIENAEAAKAAVSMDAEISKLATERDNFRARWEESLAERDRAVDEARRTSEANQALQGEVTLRSQILARIMIDPSTDKLFNERDWNDAARKVLIEARWMVSDTPSDNVLTIDLTRATGVSES
jgi:hypothetical protein